MNEFEVPSMEKVLGAFPRSPSTVSRAAEPMGSPKPRGGFPRGCSALPRAQAAGGGGLRMNLGACTRRAAVTMLSFLLGISKVRGMQ